jgi:hypothetical protein
MFATKMRNRSGLNNTTAERKAKGTSGSGPSIFTSPAAADSLPSMTNALTRADSTVYQVHVKIFMVSTGDDSGSECELTGWISFPGTGQILNFEVDLPVKESYATENGGLGRLIAEFSASRASAPNPFQAFVDEDDIGGLDSILSVVMDWTRPENVQYANGQEWTWRWFNTEDNRYQCNLWWQVSPAWE